MMMMIHDDEVKAVMPLYHKAYEIAREAHAKQTRNDGKTPYMHHINAVIDNTDELVFQQYGESAESIVESYLAIAALHDVVEDQGQDWNLSRLTRELDSVAKDDGTVDFIIDGVAAITKKPKGEETYVSYITRVLSHKGARIVKRADLMHNMSDLKPGNMLDKYTLTKFILDGHKFPNT